MANLFNDMIGLRLSTKSDNLRQFWGRKQKLFDFESNCNTSSCFGCVHKPWWSNKNPWHYKIFENGPITFQNNLNISPPYCFTVQEGTHISIIGVVFVPATEKCFDDGQETFEILPLFKQDLVLDYQVSFLPKDNVRSVFTESKKDL